MSCPLIAVRPNRTIEIDYPRLFRDADGAAYEQFLVRGFQVDEVVSMEVDQVAGSAVVHWHPRCGSASDVLMRLAETYEQSRTRSALPMHRPYFILREQGGRVIYSRAPSVVTGMRRSVYRGLGLVFFGLSVVGVWAPLVPTTPFVVLSSYYALRSSPELNERLLRSRLFGPILHDWHLHRAMRRSTKKRVLILMVIVFSLTFGLLQPAPSSLPIALLVSLFSFGFVLQMPVVEDGPALPETSRPALTHLSMAN